MLELKHISKQFQERIILDDLSITFQDKGFIGIKGESGCGKSTLLYIIGMLDDDYQGEILYNHEPILDRQQFIRSHISYMMQNKDIIEALNVKENIMLASLIGEKRVTQSTLKKITSRLGIEDLLERYPKELSGGQVKRVSIAKALLKQSSILLCDEPTGALHQKQAHEVMALLKKVSQDCLVIIVSHDDELLKEYCDYVLVMENGKLKGRMKKSDTLDISVQKSHKSPLWFYSLKQCLYQKYKLSFLFLFQWIVIVAFFFIVTALFGVFDMISENEKQSVDKNIISIEKKDGQVFDQLLTHPYVDFVDYNYALEQFQVSSLSSNYEAMMQFLPTQTSHIVLKEGRLPTRHDEIIVSASLQKELKDEKTLHFAFQDFQIDMHIVGVLPENFMRDKKIYCYRGFKESIPFLRDDYHLIIETQDLKNRDVYKELQQSYFVYSEVIERVDNYQSLLKLAKWVAFVFVSISFLVSLFLISIVESIIYLERRHDTAYLLSLGLTKRRLFFLTMGEALALGFIMAMGGCLLSVICFYYLNEVVCMKEYVFFNLQLHKLFFSKYDLYIVMILSYMVMAIIGVCMPMKKMFDEDIIDVLREE